MSDPGYWDETDPEALQNYEKRRSLLDDAQTVEQAIGDVGATLQLLDETDDRDLREEVRTRLKQIERRIEKLIRRCFLQGSYAENDTYLTIKPGAGGTEAEAWAGMLLSMYESYFEKRGWSVRTIARQDAERDGIEGCTLKIDGAYGWLRGEAGNHRLTRFSPYDDGNTKHTSFAGVDLWPDIPDPTVTIDEGDLTITTTRSSGPGGQHGDRRETAVQIVHEPTGLKASCEEQRSQQANRKQALTLLRKRLAAHRRREHEQRVSELKSDPSGSWGQRIRSYDQPDDRVVDHRTDARHSYEQVLDGRIGPFLYEYLAQNAPLPGGCW